MDSRYISKTKVILNLSFLFFAVLFLISCKKYLDKKPLQSIVAPSSLNDLQAVLDQYPVVNQQGPELLESLSDNYYISTATWSGRSSNDQLNYIWDKNAMDYLNWYYPYTGPVYYANVVLDQLKNIKYSSSQQNEYNKIKGAALFYRAFAFYELAQQYCKPYSSTPANDLGIVLRMTSDITVASSRSTVEETYQQILSDFKEAATLLPNSDLYPTRPSRAAAFGALARTYLSMRDYVQAGLYADSTLNLNNYLMDYNSLDSTASPVFPNFNKEIIYYSRPAGASLALRVSGANIDSSLYQTYDINDKRKTLFFGANPDSTYGFKGSYDGSSEEFVFDGIVTDEMYLIRAECSARNGQKELALADLNSLLKNRWKTGSFIEINANTSTEALNIILAERRKELIYRGLRWTDIRRLNLEGAGITLKRIINGVTYTLPPNDLRYVLLIPKEVIALSSVAQNPR